jgi:phosphoglycolate phosphatase-like HAD superfamily hydrolase
LRAPSIDGPSVSRKRRRREAQLQWPSTAIETIERRFVQFSLFWLILLLAALAVVVFAHVCTRRHDRSDLPLPNAAEVPGIRCGHQWSILRRPITRIRHARAGRRCALSGVNLHGGLQSSVVPLRGRNRFAYLFRAADLRARLRRIPLRPIPPPLADASEGTERRRIDVPRRNGRQPARPRPRRALTAISRSAGSCDGAEMTTEATTIDPTCAGRSSAQPLASWNDGPATEAIVTFVGDVTAEGAPTFVAPEDRIAVFDNDGTLWPEQPVPVQFAFALERIKATAGRHPEWQEREPFRSVLAGDLAKALAGGEKALVELLVATHAGMTTDEFAAIVSHWIGTAHHKRFGRLYTELVYRPMLELLAYLRDNGFRTFIVSGGGVEFLRVWAQGIYGIPPEQVIGSQGKVAFEMRDGGPVLVKLPQIDLLDDRAGKPVGIHRHIGRRPIAAFGNSDGDLEMLQWASSGAGRRLALIVHHTDGEREWAYDRDFPISALDKALGEAQARGWTVVDMKRDWSRIYAFE